MSSVRYLLLALSGVLLATSGNAAPKEDASAKIRSGEQRTAPKEILGGWRFVREKCEDGVTPGKKNRDVTIRFEPDYSYEISVEGWVFSGSYQVEQRHDSTLRVRIAPSLYDFDLIDGRLENWSEGEAVFLCGRIFEREQ